MPSGGGGGGGGGGGRGVGGREWGGSLVPSTKQMLPVQVKV